MENVSTKLLDSIVNQLVEKLKKQRIQLSFNNEDGRVNSIFNEDELIKNIFDIYENLSLFEKYGLLIEKAPARYWYDILIKNEDNSIIIPINIKISDLSFKSADNISSKAGVYFSLTGIICEKYPNAWDSFFEKLSKNIKEHPSDYYFIIANKKNNEEIFINSLRRINTLTPNGNNPPFQCEWSKNKNMKERSFDEAKQYIIGTLYKTAKLRAKILTEMEKYFPEFKKTII